MRFVQCEEMETDGRGENGGNRLVIRTILSGNWEGDGHWF